MSGWILSVTAVVCMCVLLDIIMPDGQMNKYVKGIISLIIVFVIVSPVISFAQGEINFDLSYDDVFLSEATWSSVEESNLECEGKYIELLLAKDKINADVKVYLSGKLKVCDIKIKNSVIDEESKNILLMQASNVAVGYLSIDKENVFVSFYGGKDGS